MTENTGTEPVTATDREELINMLSEVAKKLYRRISATRFRKRATDSSFLGHVRALAQIAQAMNATMRDAELEEIRRRLDRLEQERENEH